MPGYEIIGEEEKKEILEVLTNKIVFRYGFDAERKGVYKVASFEKEFAKYCGVDYALAVSSGTAALRVALAALGPWQRSESLPATRSLPRGLPL